MFSSTQSLAEEIEKNETIYLCSEDNQCGVMLHSNGYNKFRMEIDYTVDGKCHEFSGDVYLSDNDGDLGVCLKVSKSRGFAKMNADILQMNIEGEEHTFKKFRIVSEEEAESLDSAFMM